MYIFCTFNILKSSPGGHFWGDREDSELALPETLLEMLEAAALGKERPQDQRTPSEPRLQARAEPRQTPHNRRKGNERIC